MCLESFTIAAYWVIVNWSNVRIFASSAWNWWMVLFDKLWSIWSEQTFLITFLNSSGSITLAFKAKRSFLLFLLQYKSIDVIAILYFQICVNISCFKYVLKFLFLLTLLWFRALTFPTVSMIWKSTTLNWVTFESHYRRAFSFFVLLWLLKHLWIQVSYESRVGTLENSKSWRFCICIFIDRILTMMWTMFWFHFEFNI